MPVSETLNLLDQLPLADAKPDDVLQLSLLSALFDRHGQKDISDNLMVLALAVAPIDDHSQRPAEMTRFTAFLIASTRSSVLRVLT